MYERALYKKEFVVLFCHESEIKPNDYIHITRSIKSLYATIRL